MRRSGHQVSRPEAALLLRCKVHFTLLCAIRAHARGRLHLRRCLRRHAVLGLEPMEHITLEDQARWIGDRWRSYERAQEEQAAA